MRTRAAILALAGVALGVVGAVAYFSLSARPLEPPAPAEMSGADRDLVLLIERTLADVRANPRDPERWLKLGMVYEANLYVQFAEQCYETSATLGAGAEATYHLSVLRSRLGDIPGAVAAMQRTLEADESHGPAHWRLGFWLLDENRLDEAEALFREAMTRRCGPFDLAGEIGLARVHLMRGDLDRAQTVLEPLADRRSPYSAYACHLLGTALVRKGEMEAARAALMRGRAAEPVFPDPLHDQVNHYRSGVDRMLMEARVLIGRGDHDAGIKLLEEAAAQRPDDRFVRNNLALALIGGGRFAEANEQLERVLQDAPDSYQGHFNRALAAQARAAMAEGAEALAHRAEALAHLDETLRRNPSFAAALASKAEMLDGDGRHEEALELYYRALATEPTTVVWWRSAALSAAAIGDIDEAGRCIAQLEALRPGDAQVAQLAREVASMQRPHADGAAVPVRTHVGGP